MMRNILPVLFVLILLGCNTKPKTELNQKNEITESGYKENYPIVINIERDFKNQKEFRLSEIADDIEYVKLEKTPESLVGGGNSLWYATEEYYFVYNQNRLLQFDRSGKFIKQIGKQGRGPGEFLSIRGMRLNKSNNVFYVISNFKHSILKYDITTGRFLGDFPIDGELGGISNSFFQLLNDTFALMTAPATTINPDYKLLEFIDTNGNVLSVIKSPVNSKKIENGTMFANNSANQIWNFEGQLRLYETLNDTIYNIENMNLKPAYIFNLGKFKGPFDIMSGTSDKRENYLRLGLFWETRNYLFFGARYNSNGYCCQFDKKEGKFFKLTTPMGVLDYNIYNDVDGGISIPFYPFFSVEHSNNKYIVPINAIDLHQQLSDEFLENSETKYPEKKELLIKLMNNLSIDDNPILMIVKLKE